MCIFQQCNKIRESIKALASKYKYTKNDFKKDLELLKKVTFDETLVKGVFDAMSETDFCKVTEVDSCRGAKHGDCKCVKTVVFGDDEENGKLCESFTAHATSSRCKDGNLEIAGKCKITSAAGPCDLIVEQNLEELELYKKAYIKVCNILGLAEDCSAPPGDL